MLLVGFKNFSFLIIFSKTKRLARIRFLNHQHNFSLHEFLLIESFPNVLKKLESKGEYLE